MRVVTPLLMKLYNELEDEAGTLDDILKAWKEGKIPAKFVNETLDAADAATMRANATEFFEWMDEEDEEGSEEESDEE